VSGPGVYVTFFDPRESPGRALPPFGPLVDVVVRSHKLVAERRSSDIPTDPGLSIARWLEAQLEYHRATGEEAGGRKRSKMRLTAPDGLFLRFVTFGGPTQGPALRELGPFAVVAVGEREVEADGVVVAVRNASDLTTWELTPEAGADVAGGRRTDIAFRSRSTSYHRDVDTRRQPAPPAAPPGKKPAAAVGSFAPPLAELEAARSARERVDDEHLRKERVEKKRLEQIQREWVEQQQIEQDRVTREHRERARGEEERAEEDRRKRREEAERRSRAAETLATSTPLTDRVPPRAASVDATAGETGYAPEPLLWRLRFVLGGLLLLALLLYAVNVARGGFSLPTGGAASVRSVGIGETVRGPRWDYVLNNVSRAQSLGSAVPRGVFVVLRLAVTNKGVEGSEPPPGGFTLIDSAGKQYTVEPLRGEAYASQTAFAWPATFPPGRPVTAPLVFDVDPAATGLQLVIADVPQVRIRL
jgi:hypothetical protein